MKKIALLSDGWKRLVTYAWMDGIMKRIQELNLDIRLDQFNTNGNWSHDKKHNEGEYNLYQLPDFRDYDGIIFDCSNMTDQKEIDRIVKRLKKVDIPVVSISYEVEGFYYVGNDNKRLFRTVIDHVYDKHGCRNFVFAGGPSDNYENMKRFEAFKEAMEEFGLPVTEENYLFGDFDFATGTKYMEDWIKEKRPFPDCFLCANDNIAAGLCSAAIRHGLRIPEDFLVTGFDNLDKAAYYQPQITTVEHNRGNIGRNAVQILVDLWDKKKVDPFCYLYSECIPGESCGCPNSGKVDYRTYIREQIEYSVKKDRDEEEIMILENQIKNCTSFRSLFQNFSEYLESLGCDGVYIVVDKLLLEAQFHTQFPTKGYHLKQMEVGYASENMEELIGIRTYQELQRKMDQDGAKQSYLYSAIHFRDQVIGFTIMKNPVFLYDNPNFYDIHNVFHVTLESLFKQLRLENANMKMMEIYNKDALTGVYNRIAYTEMILPKFDYYCQHDIACAMIFFDVDYFKQINDTYGHRFGDEVLKCIASILVKDSPKGGLVYRFGGDEFIVFFANATKEKVDEFLEHVKEDFAKKSIKVSQGVILTDPKSGRLLDEYLVMADEKMYEIKQSRRGILMSKPIIDGEVSDDKTETTNSDQKTIPGREVDMKRDTNTTFLSKERAMKKLEQNDKWSFLKGFDISSLPEHEDGGGKFFDANGNEKEAFELLEENGVNAVRLRIWNEPSLVPESKGYCDLERTMRMAKRIKAHGMFFYLDFHYSDYWADPGQQRKPHAWETLSFEELVQAVYDYTKEVLERLESIGCLPDMVQVGNEIRSGMLFPDGAVPDYVKLAKLVNAGIRAVRDVSSEIKVMIHLDQGGRFYYLKEWFDSMFANGMNSIDCIGISFYSFWHGTFLDLKESMQQLIERYHVPVYVVETAHPWRQCPGEHVSEDLMKTAGLPAGEIEQKKSQELVMQIAATVSRGLPTGVFYWEPLCLPGCGYGTWDENMGMLDEHGKVLSAFDVYREFDPNKLPIDHLEEYIASLYEVDESELSPAGTNLVPNGDFAQGCKDWWIHKDSEEIEIREGNQEIYVSSKSNFKFKLFRDVYVNQAGKYQLMVDYRGTNTTGVKVALFLKKITCNGEALHKKDIFPSDVRFVTHSLDTLELGVGQVQLGIEIDSPPIFGRIKNIRLIRLEEE